ncbi:MAG: site-2 protease family protein, partial [Candidatus Eisenbacteria bacterium]
MRRGFDLFTIGGIRISINYTWFVVLGLVIWTLGVGYFPANYPGLGTPTVWVISVAGALLLFISVLLHELSHSFVANRLGLGIRGITLFIFGGIAHLGKEPDDPNTEIKVAAAGPACSLVLSALFFVLSMLAARRGAGAVHALFLYVAIMNGALVIFNLVPGFPLDGGRLLRAVLWKRSGDVRRATRIASHFGKGFAIVLILVGLYRIFVEKDLGGIWFVLIGMFLQQAAEGSYQQVLVRKALSGLRVSEIMSTEVVSVETSLTLDQLVEAYFF